MSFDHLCVQLWVTCANIYGKNGGGSLSAVDILAKYCKEPKQLNRSSWTNATNMACLNGKLYITCGVIGDGSGGGGLYEVNIAQASCLSIIIVLWHSFECVRFVSGQPPQRA